METRTFTENGAITFSTTQDKNLDFFACAASSRGNPEKTIAMFREALAEDYRMAILNLFHMRDIRGGSGERKTFRDCLNWIPQRFLRDKNFLRLIPEYGRWDDMLECMADISDREIRSAICHTIWDQITIDSASDRPTLCAKWFPLENSVRDPIRKTIARMIVREIMKESSPQNCKIVRQIITDIRKKLNLVETSLTEKRYSKIDYGKCPSRAFMKYRNAFKEHDGERFDTFIESLNSGEKTVHAENIYPHELVSALRRTHSEDSDVLNGIWKNLPKIENRGNILAVVDTSGSMTSPHITGSRATPIDVSIGLGLYLAENNDGIFKDTIISFSMSPSFVRFSPEESFSERVRHAMRYANCLNTNVEAVFDLFLNPSLNPRQEIPEAVVIISDMEFDMISARPVDYETVFENINRKYRERGIRRPQLIFWNVNSRHLNFPVQKDEDDAIMVAGFSPIILKYICENITPLEYMKRVLLSERYFPILDIIQ